MEQPSVLGERHNVVAGVGEGAGVAHFEASSCSSRIVLRRDVDRGVSVFPRMVASMAAIAIVAVGLAAPAAGQTAPADCPEAVPISEVQRGTTGTGYTVVQGRDPEPFSIVVLGVLRDALGPGRDMIVADATSPAIETAGGIWAGMSGSPVYVGERLMGAVAYGLSEDDSSIAGITPAQDLLNVMDYPANVPEPTFQSRAQTIELTPRLLSRVEATSAGSDSGSSLRALQVPLSVSGGRGSRLVGRAIAREGLPYIAYAGSSATSGEGAEATATSSLVPGDSFAGSFSYGDITIAEIGTTAIVCNDMAVAFGHSIYPFFPQGKTEMGANEAEVLAIVDNPNFKLATVEELVGTVDQDRLAGVRALLNVIPSAVPIRSTVTAEDLGRTLTGQTDVVVESLVPTIANVHMVDSVDSVFDQVGTGSLDASWTITGTRASGATWELTASNRYASDEDIARESFGQLAGHLFALYYNGHEEIDFTGVTAEATVREAIDRYIIGGLLVSKNGGAYRGRRRISVEPGDRLGLRVLLPDNFSPDAGSEPFFADMELKVPRRSAGRGYIQVRGGGGGGGFRACFYDGEYCARRIASRYDSFDALLEGLAKSRPNNTIVARLRLGRRGNVVSRDRATVDKLVNGEDYLQVTVER